MLYNEIYNCFVNDFAKILREKTDNLEISKLVFLCIGTDRIIGDAFGPLVGYKLKKLFREEKNIEVIGTINNNVSMQNVLNVLKEVNKIESKNEKVFIIVIDAALSRRSKIGKIVVSKDKMNIGSSLNKRNIFIGDMSIKGIVARNLNSPKYNFLALQNTSLRINNEYGKYSFRWNI